MNERRHPQTRRSVLFLLVAVLISCAGGVFAQSDLEDRTGFAQVTMRITHRIYPSFADTLTVGKLELAQIGDTEFSFEIVSFLADFGIKSDGTVVSRSSVAHNPGFQIVVYENDEETDKHWAFFGTGKPHYRRDSLLAFEVLSFQLDGHQYTQPVPRKDTSR